jgi:putative acetyltransferase
VHDGDAFEIAVAAVSDASGYVDVLASVGAEGRWIATELPFDREARVQKVLRSIADEAVLVLVARGGGEIVGCLSLHPGQWPGVVELGMAVERAWRSRGVGAALLSRGIEWARSRNAHKIALDVYPHNDGAIALYERYGFVREGHLLKHHKRRNGELWDMLVMGLVL